MESVLRLLFGDSLPHYDLWSRPLGSMVFCHAPIPQKGSHNNNSIHDLGHLFLIFSMPTDIHSDRGTAFTGSELKQFLHGKEFMTSRPTSNNPSGNDQVKHINGMFWKAITLSLETHWLLKHNWQDVLIAAKQ